MCDADAGILTYIWVEGHKDPFPDFNVYVLPYYSPCLAVSCSLSLTDYFVDSQASSMSRFPRIEKMGR